MWVSRNLHCCLVAHQRCIRIQRPPLCWTSTLSGERQRWTNSSRMVASYKAMFFVWPLGQGYSALSLGSLLCVTGLARMLRIVVRLSEPVHAVSPRCQRSSFRSHVSWATRKYDPRHTLLFRALSMAVHSWLPLDERVYPGRIIPSLHHERYLFLRLQTVELEY